MPARLRVANTSRERVVKHTLNNSSGFQGRTARLIFSLVTKADMRPSSRRITGFHQGRARRAASEAPRRARSSPRTSARTAQGERRPPRLRATSRPASSTGNGGIPVCGTGVGTAIVANRHAGIRAVNCSLTCTLRGCSAPAQRPRPHHRRARSVGAGLACGDRRQHLAPEAADPNERHAPPPREDRALSDGTDVAISRARSRTARAATEGDVDFAARREMPRELRAPLSRRPRRVEAVLPLVVKKDGLPRELRRVQGAPAASAVAVCDKQAVAQERDEGPLSTRSKARAHRRRREWSGRATDGERVMTHLRQVDPAAYRPLR